MIPYEIIHTGSKGNAVLVDGILIDCGVTYKLLRSHIQDIRLVLITHQHSDHFKISTVKRLHEERPSLKFAGGSWMMRYFNAAGIPARNCLMMQPKTRYKFRDFNVIPVELVHDVRTFGYRLEFPVGKAIYATDTGNLNGVYAKDYDLFLLEANHSESEIDQKISEKRAAGEYAYELRAKHTHLSKEKADAFFVKNCKVDSELVYLHCHEDDSS